MSLLFVALVMVSLGAVTLGFLWWIWRPARPSEQGFECYVCGDPNCNDLWHLTQTQQRANEAQAAMRRGREFLGNEVFGNEVFFPIQPPQDRVSELFSFHVKPAWPYDWAADRAFQRRNITPEIQHPGGRR